MTTSQVAANTAPAIPDELKPADGRFGCGPSKVRPEAHLKRRAVTRPRPHRPQPPSSTNN